MRTRVAVLIVLALVGVAAADSSEEEADALFQQGRAKEKAGDTAEACRLMETKVCSLMLLNAERDRLELRACHGASADYLRRFPSAQTSVKRR